jgi:hypothetical protein
MHAVDSHLEDGLLPCLADAFFHLLLGFAYHLFHSGGVNPTVGDEALECDAGDLTSDRVVARYDYRFGGIVDDQVDPRGGFDGADVATLAADDTSFHVVIRELHDGDRAFSHKLARQAFDGNGDDLPGAAIGLGARLLFNEADRFSGFVTRLIDHLLCQRPFGFFARQASNSFQLSPCFFDRPLAFPLTVAQGLFSLALRELDLCSLGLAFLDLFGAFFQVLFS